MADELTRFTAHRIHQALYGYKRGHQQLASSVEVPSDLQLRLLSLTDPALGQQIGAVQLTGAPLGMDLYALIRSWPASEIARPGAVWSHVLLVPTTMLEEIDEGAQLIQAFRRPVVDPGGGSNLEPYRVSLAIDAAVGVAESAPDPETVVALATVLYGSDNPVAVAVEQPAVWPEVVCSMWAQMWPGLRQRFSFSVGAAQDQLAGDAFDLQIASLSAPRLSSILLEPTFHGRPKQVAVGGAPDWPRIVARDALKPQKRFRHLVYRYGLELREVRTSLAHLVETLLVVYDGPARAIDDVTELVRRCDIELADQGDSLKRSIAGSPSDVDHELVAADDHTILAALVQADPRSFGAAIPEFENRIVNWWEAGADTAFDAFISAGTGQVATAFVRASVRRAMPAVVAHLRHETPDAIVRVVSRSPDLATSPEVWRASRIEAQRMAEGIVHQQIARRQRVVSAAVAAGVQDLASIFVEAWGTKAASAGIRASVGKPSWEEWVRAVEVRPDLMLDILGDAQLPDEAIARWIDDDAISPEDISSRIELSRLESVANKVSRPPIRQLLWALVFIAGLQEPLPMVSMPLTDAFVNLHEAAADDALDSNAWSVIEKSLVSPRRFWDWDRCDRLRRTWVRAILRVPDPSSAIRLAVDRIRYPYDLVDNLRKSDKGRALVREYPSS